MKKIGFTTTIPVEFVLAGGNIPVDLNNVFVCNQNPNHLIDEAQDDGLPRNCCSWIKGLYSVAVKEKAVDEVISVTNGDCSNTHALTELYISNGIKNYISSNLKYEIYDFVYNTAEYDYLKDKKFQMLVVEDTPEFIPFLSKRESGSLKQNMIYVRRGTSCEIANEEELQSILERRINYLHPLSGEPLSLEEHLNQLKILYDNIDEEHVYYKNGLSKGMKSIFDSVVNVFGDEKVVEPNPLYPSENYEQFISRMINAKKKKIERILDLY